MNESSVAVRYLYTPHHGGAATPGQEGAKSDALVYRRCSTHRHPLCGTTSHRRRGWMLHTEHQP